jgi:hypothetical protein
LKYGPVREEVAQEWSEEGEKGGEGEDWWEKGQGVVGERSEEGEEKSEEWWERSESGERGW